MRRMIRLVRRGGGCDLCGEWGWGGVGRGGEGREGGKEGWKGEGRDAMMKIKMMMMRIDENS